MLISLTWHLSHLPASNFALPAVNLLPAVRAVFIKGKSYQVTLLLKTFVSSHCSGDKSKFFHKLDASSAYPPSPCSQHLLPCIIHSNSTRS